MRRTMTRACALSLAALGACTIDARAVGLCVDAPADGLISDFSTARLGLCNGAPCPEVFASNTTVSLGTTGVVGLVFPYEQPTTVTFALGLTGDLHSVSDASSALRIVMSYDSQGHPVPTDTGAFALALEPCLDVTGFTGITFQVEGKLGTCPLHASALVRDPGATTGDATCPLEECRVAPGVLVGGGLSNVPFPAPVGAEAPAALVGLAWQFDVPADGSRTCDAAFTIDDLRLSP